MPLLSSISNCLSKVSIRCCLEDTVVVEINAVVLVDNFDVVIVVEVDVVEVDVVEVDVVDNVVDESGCVALDVLVVDVDVSVVDEVVVDVFVVDVVVVKGLDGVGDRFGVDLK